VSQTIDTEVVIVGAGPAGTASAINLARNGIASVLVEKDPFPRYHIGESLTGEAGQRLRELGLERYMTKAAHPLKFGVNVYGPAGKHTFTVPVMERDMNGKLQSGQTWQVPRELFDHRMLEEARKCGAGYLQGKAYGVIRESDALRGIEVRDKTGKIIRVNSKVVVDASGPATFLNSSGLTSRKMRGGYDKQVAIYSQLAGGIRSEGAGADNTLILYREKNHWAWFIPLGPDVVSVGVVVPSDYFKASGESLDEFFRREVNQLNPELKRRFPKVELLEPVRASSNYSYAIDQFAGNGFLCVGDSHRFIDPVFSLGVQFALHEAAFAADAIADVLGNKAPMNDASFDKYQKVCTTGLDSIQEMIDAFWNHSLAFTHAAHVKYKEDIIDLFAGRIYQDTPSPGLLALKKINEKSRQTDIQAKKSMNCP